MQQIIKKLLINDRDATHVPFNYMIAKFPVPVIGQDEIDVVNGRHTERTFFNSIIQNSRTRKQLFCKPITRYEAKL